jgi:predicted HicB family RNase H-like nuclease
MGSVLFSAEDGVFHGEIVGVSDSVSYEGEDIPSLEEDFHNAVEEYLEYCKAAGKQPEKSYAPRAEEKPA